MIIEKHFFFFFKGHTLLFPSVIFHSLCNNSWESFMYTNTSAWLNEVCSGEKYIAKRLYGTVRKSDHLPKSENMKKIGSAPVFSSLETTKGKHPLSRSVRFFLL